MIITSMQREDSGGQELGCASGAHTYKKMGGQSVRTKPIDRNVGPRVITSVEATQAFRRKNSQKLMG
jgi:hypothetical protein